MSKLKELYDFGIKQGYLEYRLIEETLRVDSELMPDQIRDLVEFLEDLGIKVTNKPKS